MRDFSRDFPIDQKWTRRGSISGLCSEQGVSIVAGGPRFQGGSNITMLDSSRLHYYKPRDAEIYWLPIDQDELEGAKNSFWMWPYAVFGEDTELVQLDGAAYLNVAQLCQDPRISKETSILQPPFARPDFSAILPFLQRYGPLRALGCHFTFSRCSPQFFLDKHSSNAYPENERLLKALSQEPYFSRWTEGRLRSVCGEGALSWLRISKKLHGLCSVVGMIEREDFSALLEWLKLYFEHVNSVNSDFMVRRLEPYSVNRLEDVPEEELIELVRKQVFGLVNLELARGVRLHLDSEGMLLLPTELRSALWLQFARSVTTKSENFQCEGCGWWFEVTGKARGRKKKTCSNACRVRLSQRRKVSEGGQGNQV